MTNPGDSARTDEQLVEDYLAGDGEAFAALHDRHVAEITNYIRGRYFIGCDQSLADDAVQNAFIRLCEYAPSLNLSEPIRPWLFSVAASCAIDIRRWHKRRPSVSINALFAASPQKDFDLEDTEASTTLEELVADDWADAARAGIDTLSDDDRAAIETIYFEGCSFNEAAQLLEIPIGSLKTRVHRALRTLRCRLDPAEPVASAA